MVSTILIAGSKTLGSDASAKRGLAEMLGSAVVSQPDWRLLTGGACGTGCAPGQGGVDFHAALGAQKKLSDPGLERERILTIHPRDTRSDLFRIGSVISSRARSTPARRFELVARADSAILIEGHEGTGQIIEYSIAAGKPIIPIACSGGESQNAWTEGKYRDCLLQSLGLDEGSQEMVMIKQGLATPMDVAETCIRILRKLLRPTCFVVMSFNLSHSDLLWQEVLRPCIDAVGMIPVRADIVHNVGEILEDVTRCISEAALVIVDITGTNPNVMYELGYAHALAKPTILICDAGQDNAWDKGLPFDIRGMRVLPIDPWKKDCFVRELQATLAQFGGCRS